MADLTIESRDPASLRNHTTNIQIYGDLRDDEFVESVRLHGIREPLIILPDDRIVSGHRRRQAAMICGIETVPVLVAHDLVDELDIQEALILHNRQRIKTNEQKAREAQHLMQIEQERAAARKAATQLKPGDKLRNGSTTGSGTNRTVEKQIQRETGEAAQRVAERLHVSPTTARNLTTAAKGIDEAEASGDPERAEAIRKTLNTKGARPAADLVKKRVKVHKATAPMPPCQVDGFRNEVPQELIPVFESRSAFMRISTMLRDATGAVKVLAGQPQGALLHLNSIQVHLEAVIEEVKNAAPYVVCPDCDGTGHSADDVCAECQGRKWVSKSSRTACPGGVQPRELQPA